MVFTETTAGKIARITPDAPNTITEFPIPTANSRPLGITAGPDDAMWFTTMSSGQIGRIATDGEISTQAVVGGMPSMITKGPDDALWFTLNEAGKVGRLTVDGALTVRELPTAAAGPVGIAATHDDAIWFTEILAEQLGRIPMDDAIQEVDLPGKPHAVVADPDEHAWEIAWNPAWPIDAQGRVRFGT